MSGASENPYPLSLSQNPGETRRKQAFDVTAVGGYSVLPLELRKSIALVLHQADSSNLTEFLEKELNANHHPALIRALEKLLGDRIDIKKHIERFARGRGYVNSSRVTLLPDVLTQSEARQIAVSNPNVNMYQIKNEGNREVLGTLRFMASLKPGGIYLQRYCFTRALTKDGDSVIAQPFLFYDRRVESFLSRWLDPETFDHFEELLTNVVSNQNHDLLGHSLIDKYINYERLGDPDNNLITKKFFQTLDNCDAQIEEISRQYNPTNYEVVLAILLKRMWQQAMQDNSRLEQQLVAEWDEYQEVVDEAITHALGGGADEVECKAVERFLISIYAKYLHFIFPPDHKVFIDAREKFSWFHRLSTRFHKTVHETDGLSLLGREIPALDFLERFISLCDYYDDLEESHLLKRQAHMTGTQRKKHEKELKRLLNQRVEVSARGGKKKYLEDVDVLQSSDIDDSTYAFVFDSFSEDFDPWVIDQVVLSAIHEAKKAKMEPSLIEKDRGYTKEEFKEAFILFCIAQLALSDKLTGIEAQEYYSRNVHRVSEEGKLRCLWLDLDWVVGKDEEDKNTQIFNAFNRTFDFIRFFRCY